MTASPPQPTVSRTGSGTGARAAAVTTVVALVIVVMMAISGRAPAHAPAPSRGATLEPRRAPAVSSGPFATPDQVAAPAVSPTPLPRTGDVYVINGIIADAGFRTELVEHVRGSGRFSAQYWTAEPLRRNGALAFEITPSFPAVRSRGDTLGSWLLNLESLAANHRAGREGHTAIVAGRRAPAHAPSPVRQGFAIHVSVALAFDHVAMIDFQLHVARDDSSVRGTDGIVGCLPFATCAAQD